MIFVLLVEDVVVGPFATRTEAHAEIERWGDYSDLDIRELWAPEEVDWLPEETVS